MASLSYITANPSIERNGTHASTNAMQSVGSECAERPSLRPPPGYGNIEAPNLGKRANCGSVLSYLQVKRVRGTIPSTSSGAGECLHHAKLDSKQTQHSMGRITHRQLALTVHEHDSRAIVSSRPQISAQSQPHKCHAEGTHVSEAYDPETGK